MSFVKQSINNRCFTRNCRLIYVTVREIPSGWCSCAWRKRVVHDVTSFTKVNVSLASVLLREDSTTG